MRGLRISMVSEHASPLATLGGVDAGGQNVHVAELARALAARGDEVVVHTRREDPDLPDRVELAPGVEVHHVDAGPAQVLPKDDLLAHMDSFADGLRETWLRERPDVVHSHFWMSGLASLAASGGLGIPVAHTFHALGTVKRRHQGERDTSPPARLAIERGVARNVDRVIATCSDEVFELLRMGADRHRVSVVPCGVDREAFTPAGERDRRTPGVRFRLVMANRLVERKGVADVVRALAELPDTELHVAGGPEAPGLEADPEARRLRALADSLGVADRFVLRGRMDRTELAALLRSADVVVCAPWYEPFGLVPLEAMACGVPVIATAVGGQIDSVVHERTGLHVPPQRPDLIARAVLRLLERPAWRRALGEAGVRRVRERFGFDRVAAGCREVYGALVDASTSTVPSVARPSARFALAREWDPDRVPEHASAGAGVGAGAREAGG